MNLAFVDGSYGNTEGTDENIPEAGWGVVLLLPGQPPRLIQGRSLESDNNASELRAVLEALRSAPTGQPLTVHTDNTSVISAVRRGSLSAAQDELGALIRGEALERGVALTLTLAGRERRHMRLAHDLANLARLERPLPELSQTVLGQGLDIHTSEVHIDQRPWRAEASVTLRRSGERLHLQLPLNPASSLPPTAQVLLAALDMAQPGETLLVRGASGLARALWEKPKRAMEGSGRERLEAARSVLAEREVRVLFQD